MNIKSLLIKKSGILYRVQAMLLASMCLFSACTDLEEYNPGKSSAENTFTTPNGYAALVNQCYSNLRAYCYGREDMLFMGETGTDIWHPAYNRSYAPQINKYQALNSATGLVKNVWERFYVPINLCNAAIDRVDQAGYTDEKAKNAKVAEAYFIRAFIYWHIVEWYGNVSLSLHETSAPPMLNAYRSPVSAFYETIFSDLKFAVENLPVDHAAKEYGRATKKAAHGLLARMYLTYASYLKYHEKNDTEAAKYYELASQTAKDVIANASTYGVQLYTDFEQVFDPKNNKGNKEALYVISHSTNAALEVNSSNPNRLFQWYQAKYSDQPGMQMSLEYSRDGQAFMQPTKYLLELFDETIDARYKASFQEVWLCNNAAKNKWDPTAIANFGKDPVVFKDLPVAKNGVGDTALYYTKRYIADKKTRQYAVFDMADMFKTDGTLANPSSSKAFFPSLRKFRDPNRPDPNSQAGGLDVIMIRLAEMYLIVAEAEFHLGHEDIALGYVNTLRTRAAIKAPVDMTAKMQVTSDTISKFTVSDIPGHLNFILDERARELCGEHLRWFDLKRTKQLENRLGPNAPIKGNPNITLFDKTMHYVRPVPLAFLQSIENAEEFGQNPGY